MASTYLRSKRPGEAYTMCVKVGGKKITRSTGKTDPREAQEFAEKIEAELRAQTLAPLGGCMSLSEAINNCFEGRWQFNSSGDDSKRMATAFVTHLGNVHVGNITTQMVRTAASKIRQTGIAEPTVNRYLASLRTVMNYAKEDIPIKMPKFHLTKETNNRMRFYSVEEEQMIIDYFNNQGLSDMADLVIVLCDTGFRLSEALNIGKVNLHGKYYSTFDLKTGLVTSWINKGKKVRSVPMTTRVREILTKRGKTPFPDLNRYKVCRLWSGRNRKGGVRAALNLGPDGVLHSWRHTCASRLVQAGISLQTVKQWLGHSNICVTEKYAHLAPNALQMAAHALEKSSN